MSRSQFLAVILAGLLLRAIALPGPGTGDLTVFKVWTYNAARHGVADMYGTSGPADQWHPVEYAGVVGYVVYPPLALYQLAAAGQLYWLWSHHHFPNTVALNAFVKLPAFLAEIGLVLLLFGLTRRRLGTAAARWSVAAYWINPAALINASVLGYLDAQFALPAVAALAAAALGWPMMAGAFVAGSILTKPQGLFIAPAVALALWAAGTPDRRLTRFAWATLGGSMLTAIVLGPITMAGGLPHLLFAMGRGAHHDMVSANACNLWWIVGYALRVRYSAADLGLWAAITAPARILGIPRIIEIGYPDPLMIGVVLTMAATAWALWTARKRDDLWLLAGVGGFTIHAYATLSAQVHENHMFGAVPLLVLAAAGRAGFRPILLTVSAIVALNLNLFYGFGQGVGYGLPRSLTVIDATVLLSVVNCAALCWHAAVLHRESSKAVECRRTSAPA
ncbi:MAG TPA: hypothetical protein VGH34_00755 [Vicinamibacterales bacterium]